MNTEQALLHLAGTTSDAVRDALSALAPGEVLQKGARVNSSASRALDGTTFPAVSASIAYVEGVEGGNVLLMPVEVARRLAAAMAGQEAGDTNDAPLTEFELSAVGEAMNQVMSSAAAATGSVLRHNVEIAAPQTRVVDSESDLGDAFPDSGQATSADFSLFGLECRFVHLLPPKFLTLLEQALGVDPEGEHRDPLRDAMLDVDVRVWAELGRARMSSQRAVALPRGSVVELDREADDPIDLYVDGLHYGTGRLVVTDEGELAVRLETVGAAPSRITTESQEAA
ncbi:MAG: flagellar motor switch protein FliN [Solirubrobacteraceae bacterium]|nr:flagellar motor switch protein FliN [Solirubrobacteraceae bacterium]